MAARSSRLDAVRFPPHVLREYSLIADGERGVVVGPRGDFAWLCVPSWNDDAVFSTLLGGRGVYAVAPADRWYVWGGYYEDGTLIWRDRWVVDDAITECREALAFPGDPHTAVLLRRVIAVRHAATVDIVLDPRAGFGRYGMSRLRCESGVWRGRSGPLSFRWQGAPDAQLVDGELRARIHVPEGRHHDLILELSDRTLGEPTDGSAAWDATEHAWASVVPDCSATLAPRTSRAACALLRGLTSASGAVVAAATTSLPERADEGRNYDYRYAWIRDQAYAGEAVAALADLPMLESWARFVTERVLEDGPALKPAYRTDGGRVPDERVLTLPGYPGGAARVGNWVNRQFQLDSLGEALLLLAAAARRDRLSDDGRRAAVVLAEVIEQRYAHPDAGIWELDDHLWTHSRLVCVAGLNAAARAVADPRYGAAWTSLADAILAETASVGLHPSGRWQRAADDDRVDAALVLPAVRGALPADDPRTAATLEAVRTELVRDGYAYRYRIDERELGEAEGAFQLCGFALALALHQQGEQVEAARWFERNIAACGPAGLFSEEYDVMQRQMRGNLPQAFVHAMALEASTRLAGPWQEHGALIPWASS